VERWRQIESVFQEALQRDPAERDAYVREACHGDAGLQREVFSLLANHQEASDFKPWAAAAAAQLITRSGSLKVGQRLGPYEMVAPIGAGGMGEVYKARDTRLKRDVAIKVCAAQFSERFEREARVIASLNHPNICQLYDVGPNYLVMELVEGENLSGPLPVETALNYARQMAEALETAHEKGIVHRDLKPGNVKITPAGVVKVLDFGLAKAVEEPAAAGDPSNSPTLTMSPTQAGVILGTAPYMSPEQARGTAVGKRADIWAFGCVLYEMLTGKQTFQGETTSDILAAVLKQEPDWSPVPARVQPLLRRCLIKDPNRRLRDIGDAMLLLEGAPEVVSSRRPWAWIALAAALTVALALLAFVHFRETPPRGTVLRYSIPPPENTSTLHSFAISPDGRHVAISAVVNGKLQLWLRPLDALQAQPMAGTELAQYPFWSPDSRYIGFFAQGKLKKIAAGGGPAQSLCDAPTGAGGSWNRDNTIVFSPNFGPGGGARTQRVPAAGGLPVEVTRNKGSDLFPVFLPDGRHFLYLVRGGSAEQSGIYLGSLDARENRRVLADESSVIFAGGRLLFIRGNILMAQPFDVSSGQISGEPSPVAEGVFFIANGSYAPVSASETGVLLYESGGTVAGGNTKMVWYDRGGKLVGAIDAPGGVFEPAISPNEKAVVFRRISASPPGQDLWLWDLARGAEQRFTTDSSPKFSPFWAPKGDRIVYASSRGGAIFNIYQKAASGIGREEVLLATGNSKLPSQWSRDGRFIVYTENDPTTKRDVWVLPMDGGADRKPAPFLHSEFNELHGQLSPDDRWMAYTSDKTGRREVYVAAFPTGEGETRVSLAGGEQPRWRGDGKELFFVTEDGKMMAVRVKADAPSAHGDRPFFEPGTPEPLFDVYLPVHGRATAFEYDVIADGKRFLVDNQGGVSTPTPPLTAVVNWDAGFKK
jgi:serine/threonine protein kinase/Tol biopolymer transport system component